MPGRKRLLTRQNGDRTGYNFVPKALLSFMSRQEFWRRYCCFVTISSPSHTQNTQKAMIRHVLSVSCTRYSWHRGPITDIGRDCGMLNVKPHCNCLKSLPAASRASLDIGGVFRSPCSSTTTLSSMRYLLLHTCLLKLRTTNNGMRAGIRSCLSMYRRIGCVRCLFAQLQGHSKAT